MSVLLKSWWGILLVKIYTVVGKFTLRMILELLLVCVIQDKFLKSEGIGSHVGIAEFLAGVHTACCRGDHQPDRDADKGREGDADTDSPRPRHHHLPGVAALLNTITVFSHLLKERKSAIKAKVRPWLM